MRFENVFDVVFWTIVFLGFGAAIASAQEPARTAIDTSVARVLSEAWKRQPGDSLACLHGRAKSDVLEVDSATIAFTCGGRGVIGVFGFLPNEHQHEQAQVQQEMVKVLIKRPDLSLAGQVYGIDRVFMFGQWFTVPKVWWAIRPPQQSPTERVS